MATILVIDSDLNARRRTVEALKEAGHETFEAGNGVEGLTLYRTRRPALVITEVVLPVKDGLEILGELRRDAGAPPTIALCGERHGRGLHYLKLARALGADATIAKPFDPDDLVATVEWLL